MSQSDSNNIISFDGEGLRLDTSEQAEVICNKLADNNEVEVLILQGNTFGIEAAERVGQELALQSNLREAHFKDLFTSRGRDEVPDAMGHLLRGIRDSGAQLTLLDLSDNAIGPIGAPSVIEFLNSPSADTIEKLYLNNCGLGPEGSTSIATTIPRLTKLREFICGRNRLEIKGATNISRALSELRNLEILKFNQNGIQVEGIVKLAGVLELNSDSIREIDLSDNWIKAEGAEALAKFITRATKLTKLILSDAFLENKGFSIICDALSRSPSFRNMKEAVFEGNDLGGSKIVDLVELTFSKCKSGFFLNLLENDFAADELTRLENLPKTYTLYVDDVSSDGDYEDDDDDNGDKEHDDGDESEASNGYVDLSNVNLEFREVVKEFIDEFNRKPLNEGEINSAFIQMISIGDKPDSGYQSVQILCEELGLMKDEESRKKKPLARDAIIYISKRLDDLPNTFREFFKAVMQNCDDFGCVKTLLQVFP